MVLAAILAAGCAPPTRILLVVDSELRPGVDYDRVSLAAGPASGLSTTRELTALPATALLEASGAERVRIGVRALRGDEVRVGWALETDFEPGRTVRVEVPLTWTCVGNEACARGVEHCVDGACEPVERSIAALPDGDPGDAVSAWLAPVPPPDAGAPLDAGPGCEEGAPCVPASRCHAGALRCAASPACEPGAPLPAGAPCGEGRQCDGAGLCGR